MHKITEGCKLPRCKKHRCCRSHGDCITYKPVAVPMSELEIVQIAQDEFEAMRLCDLDDLDQTAAGEKMGVSRGTIQRLLANGRRKLLEALLTGRALQVDNEGVGIDENLHTDLGE